LALDFEKHVLSALWHLFCPLWKEAACACAFCIHSNARFGIQLVKLLQSF